MKRFKVDKKKFMEAWEYFTELGKYSLVDLDLSEFGIKKLSREIIAKWEFTGLSNKDFISRNFIKK